LPQPTSITSGARKPGVPVTCSSKTASTKHRGQQHDCDEVYLLNAEANTARKPGVPVTCSRTAPKQQHKAQISAG
jgi:hypothetical protein